MSESIVNPAGAVGVVGGDTAPQFVMWQGQPWSAEMAENRRAELLRDDSYRTAATNGDTAKQQELAALFSIARFGRAPDAPPATVAEIFAGMSKADQERAAQMREWQRERCSPQNDVEAFEFERAEATASQKEAARRNIERAKRDPVMARKIVNGDGMARMAWDRWHFIAHGTREIAG